MIEHGSKWLMKTHIITDKIKKFERYSKMTDEKNHKMTDKITKWLMKLQND
jgi:hypothetical protein